MRVRQLSNQFAECLGRLWYSVSSARRKRRLVYRLPGAFSHYARATIRLLRRPFTARFYRLAWQSLLWAGLGMGAVLIVAIGWEWLYAELWIWLSNDEEDPARTLRDVILALAAPIGITLAVWRSRVAAAGLLHDRYQRGAEMLGHPDLRSVRLGGIHALASLADKNRSTLHLQTMRLFAAFVVERTNAHRLSEIANPTEPSDPRTESDAESDSTSSDSTGADTDIDEYFRLMRASMSAASDVPDLSEDVLEAMRLIAGRDRRQVALERRAGVRFNLSGAVLPRLVQLQPTANLSNIDFTDAELSRARLWQSRFSGTVMSGARLLDASLDRADLRGVDMRGADLSGAQLPDADLRNSDLGPRNRVGEWATGWEARVTRLRGAQLQGADLRGATLCSADLQMARMAGVNLDNADLSGANLRSADLKSAVLYEANLARANLSNADLGGFGADLRRANLTGADLTGANLSLAILAGATLTDANLSGADFSRHHRSRELAPATGLTQDQIDQAKAHPGRPPNLEGVLDPVTGRPLVWRGRPT